MNKSFLIAAVMAITASVAPANAAGQTSEPFKDLKKVFGPLNGQIVETRIEPEPTFPEKDKNGNPTGNCIKCIIKDQARITIKPIEGVPIYVSTYFTILSGALTSSLSDKGTLTDIWAFDLQPELTDPLDIPLVTGFDPLNPSLIVEDETFIGFSGKVYHASLVTSTLANLPSILPGFNLSHFIGDQNSIVYVAQAEVPFSDYLINDPCPVPAPLPLLGVGAAFGSIRKLRKFSSQLKRPFP